MNVRLKLDPSSSIPIFEQIVAEFEALIISGTLKEGEVIPSVRDLAVHHGINPNTVSKAYQALQRLNLIEPIRGVGLQVGKLDTKASRFRRAALLNAEVDRMLAVATTLKATPSELIRIIETRWPADKPTGKESKKWKTA